MTGREWEELSLPVLLQKAIEQGLAAEPEKIRRFCEAVYEQTGADCHLCYEWMLTPNPWVESPSTYTFCDAIPRQHHRLAARLLRDAAEGTYG